VWPVWWQESVKIRFELYPGAINLDGVR